MFKPYWVGRKERKQMLEKAKEIEHNLLKKVGNKAEQEWHILNVIEAKKKRKEIAALLSLIIPGAGHIYVGKIWKGLAIMVVTFALTPMVVGLVFWIWNIFDAMSEVEDYNAQITIEVASEYGLA